MEGIEWKGSVYRIKKCAFDFFSMEDDLVDDDDDSWELMGRDLRLKSTFLFCDLNQVIASSCDEYQKKTLTDLANKLFYCMEELGHAVESRSISLTQEHYNGTAIVLQEVMTALIHPTLD
ncbi:photosynthetic NDH subunit of lumenal location 3, chloroplastic-like [Asparagus officinalis]|uniref:photosynthetic NDH subunit of lumenal location 3, chloroplastic-like n=1 Tax=Asparagus officinalis TaxID=4686 RepID=UPI00098DF2A2|nr:photosynthetic NDH subunit of lumenal location 3, chloroplastic-like [Asparagus officinalis]XP_020263832.1 photosynthetic NDH subunit of lumenal location 3, chloroplastic-like [Asparagus officinalis]XP_020263833.1 photosynthetic NDH subunit of lumenal location 3, chloroplastic-like [Asparagus officinalis]XP_020263834.1 photosynthetic NDH subunit of lumenal location 3, chloroplastic-like [Asparagus officinalis]